MIIFLETKHLIRRFFIGFAIILLASCTTAKTNAAADADNEESLILSLPEGFSPDGITIGSDGTIFVASFFDGTIVRGRTDESEIAEILVPGEEGRPGWGMDLDNSENYLFVAGGFAGTARIYNAETGVLEEDISLTDGGIVNDVIVTKDAAYFTNSSLPEIYELPINSRGNVSGKPRVITLSGDFEFGADYFANANGIDYAGEGLLIVNHSYLGKMYAIDIETGIARDINLMGERVSSDGIALDGSTLYGVEAPENRVAELRLSDDLGEAVLLRRFSSEIFDFPTLIALDDTYVYVINGKLTSDRGPEVPYEVIRLPR